MRPRGTCAVAMALCASCYTPSLPEAQPCSETDRCPDGLTCDLATHDCLSALPGVARFVQLSAFASHACGIDPDGALWCWGNNTDGQLGTGDTTNRLIPTRVGVDSDWSQVSAGRDLTCGIRGGDELWCWGRGVDDPYTRAKQPVRVPGAFNAVSVGRDLYCAISRDGAVSCRIDSGFAPTGFPGTATELVAGSRTICVLDASRDMFCWGDNLHGEVGTNDLLSRPAAAANRIAGPWQTLSMGDEEVCGLRMDGALWCWGSCGEGQLGRDTSCLTPARVDTATYLAVGAGDQHTCAVRSDGAMVCAGRNHAGQLGANGDVSTSTPTPIPGIAGWTDVAAGYDFTCGLRADHEAWCWGTNANGELGDGGGGVAFAPVPIEGGSWDSIHVNVHTTCGIQTDRSLWCFGANAFGQLGDGTTIERHHPVQVGAARDWLAVAPGRAATCGIREPGTLWCWGNNEDRQLGVGTDVSASAPVQVGTATTWTEVAVTDRNTCGVAAGELYCWGSNIQGTPDRMDRRMTSLSASPNGFGAIDRGRSFDWTDRPGATPVEPTVTDWTTISDGDDHMCGLRGDQVWCYGRNGFGQLGDDTLFDAAVAVQERTRGSWAAVDAGDAATCAIAADGHLACWGWRELLASGPDADDAGAAVTVGTATWRSISVGQGDACGVQTDHTLYCWGAGDAGARGDGRGGHERPTRVVPP